MRHAGSFVMLAVLVLFSGCTSYSPQTAIQTNSSLTPAQTNSSQTGIAQNTGTAAAVVTISGSRCTPKEETDQYGDVTDYNEIQFSGSASGPVGTKMNVFLIDGGGVPEENALLCNAWKNTGFNSCTSELSDPTLWSFIWRDYAPHTTRYAIRATVSLGGDKTLAAYCP